MLWETLDKSTINKRLTEAKKSFYKGSISKIKVGNHITEGFTVTKGLRQGCSLSPTLFKILAELILQPSRHFTYVTPHSPSLPSLYLRHSSFSNPSVASPTSQLILQPFFRFSYVTKLFIYFTWRAAHVT